MRYNLARLKNFFDKIGNNMKENEKIRYSIRRLTIGVCSCAL
ncbi:MULTISPECIES: YSIRK-type signal peptide-containing protein [Helcococcus]|uniref:YSIRK-type signal peptide-containing protein n=1 Tax=Helcococcus bovis TaxID=3153252 RepID=A0ABW9F893_9FIRM